MEKRSVDMIRRKSMEKRSVDMTRRKSMEKRSVDMTRRNQKKIPTSERTPVYSRY
jgi:hypothetical protein